MPIDVSNTLETIADTTPSTHALHDQPARSDDDKQEPVRHTSVKTSRQYAHDPSAAGDQPADEGVIRCVCEMNEDDGFTIQCERCLAWQHGICVGVTQNNVPDEYLCERCLPREIDVKAAKETQRRLREMKLSRGIRGRGGQVGARARFTVDGRVRRKPGPVPRSRSNTTSLSLPPLTRKALDPSVPSHESSVDLFAGFMGKEHELEYNPLDVSFCASMEAESVCRRMHATYGHKLAADAPPVSHFELEPSAVADTASPIVARKAVVMRARGCAHVKPIQHTDALTSVCSARYGLFAKADVPCRRYVTEVAGWVETKQAFLQDTLNQYDLIGTSKPMTFLHPAADLAIDARFHGNETRFIRRSCKPNCSARTVVLYDTAEPSHAIRLAIFATKDIRRGDELTLPWEFKPAHVCGNVQTYQPDAHVEEQNVHRAASYKALLSFVECACDRKPRCRIEKLRKWLETYQRHAVQVMHKIEGTWQMESKRIQALKGRGGGLISSSRIPVEPPAPSTIVREDILETKESLVWNPSQLSQETPSSWTLSMANHQLPPKKAWMTRFKSSASVSVKSSSEDIVVVDDKEQTLHKRVRSDDVDNVRKRSNVEKDQLATALFPEERARQWQDAFAVDGDEEEEEEEKPVEVEPEPQPTKVKLSLSDYLYRRRQSNSTGDLPVDDNDQDEDKEVYVPEPYSEVIHTVQALPVPPSPPRAPARRSIVEKEVPLPRPLSPRLPTAPRLSNHYRRDNGSNKRPMEDRKGGDAAVRYIVPPSPPIPSPSPSISSSSSVESVKSMGDRRVARQPWGYNEEEADMYRKREAWSRMYPDRDYRYRDQAPPKEEYYARHVPQKRKGSFGYPEAPRYRPNAAYYEKERWSRMSSSSSYRSHHYDAPPPGPASSSWYRNGASREAEDPYAHKRRAPSYESHERYEPPAAPSRPYNRKPPSPVKFTYRDRDDPSHDPGTGDAVVEGNKESADEDDWLAKELVAWDKRGK